MFKIKVRTHFDAAHRLPEYKGKCANIHGHTWGVEVEIRAKELDGQGMVCDFFDVQQILNGTIDKLDHNYINEIEPFSKETPTSENIARYIFNEIKNKVEALREGLKLASVTISESPNASATYYE